MTVYEPGQVKAIYPYLLFKPEWFLLGGPADATEAHDMRSKFPHLAIAGFEPNPLFYNLQRARQFPGLLLPYALWNERTTLEMQVVSHQDGLWQEQRSASILKFLDHPDRRRAHVVEARTLDDLSDEFGPFKRAVLWIDIEGSEIQCLRGARRLLEAGEIRVINAEVEEWSISEIEESV